MSHAAMPPEEREQRGITNSLFRLSVGLENPDDLIKDFSEALEVAKQNNLIKRLKNMNFLKRMENEILIADGAMGTLLYSFGKDSCLEELNLSHPEQIVGIHQAYLHAGADIIQTNTYAANYLKLNTLWIRRIS